MVQKRKSNLPKPNYSQLVPSIPLPTETNFESESLQPNREVALNYRSSIMIQFQSMHQDKLSACNINIKDFRQYGIGLELYFQTIKQISLVFLLISVISIVPLYENYMGGGLEDIDKKQPWDAFTLANQKTFNNTMSELEAKNQINSPWNPKILLLIADLIYTLVFLFFILYSHMRSKEIIKANWNDIVTAADYAVEIIGLPCEAFLEDELEPLFRKYGQTKEIYLAKKYDGLLELAKERVNWIIAYKYHNNLRYTSSSSEIQAMEIQKRIENLDNMISRIGRIDSLSVIKAYITYDKLNDKIKCLKAFKNANSFCGRYPKDMKFRNKYKLKVTTTIEPSNIIWENLEYNNCKRFLRQMIAVMIACLTVIISVILLYLIRSIDDGLPDKKQCLVEYNVDTSVSISIAKEIYKTHDQEYCYCRSQSIADIAYDFKLNNYCSYYLKQRT